MRFQRSGPRHHNVYGAIMRWTENERYEEGAPHGQQFKSFVPGRSTAERCKGNRRADSPATLQPKSQMRRFPFSLAYGAAIDRSRKCRYATAPLLRWVPKESIFINPLSGLLVRAFFVLSVYLLFPVGCRRLDARILHVTVRPRPTTAPKRSTNRHAPRKQSAFGPVQPKAAEYRTTT
jgi:hypothetical protein